MRRLNFKPRLFHKFFLFGTTLVLTTAGTLGVIFNIHMRKIVFPEVIERGSVLAENLARNAQPSVETRDVFQTLGRLVQSARDQKDVAYVHVLDAGGRVLASSLFPEGSAIQEDPTRRELAAFGNGVRWVGSTRIVEIEKPVASVQRFVLDDPPSNPARTRSIGAVRVGMSTESFERGMREGTIYSLSLIIGVVIAGALAAFLLGRQISRPIRLLADGAGRIAQGEYGATVPALGRDEVGDLARRFNHMSLQLAETTVSKEFMARILESMLDPLIVTHPDGTLRMLNRAALELLGYEEAELKGKPAEVLFAGKDHPFRNPEQNAETHMADRKGEKIQVLFSSSALRDADGRMSGMIGVAKDLRDRKKLELLVRQSEKMSATGQLTAGIAHEINNPLGVILGFAQALARRLSPGDPLEIPVKSIEREAVRCKNLVQDLLTFSRASKTEREPMDLNRAIEGALSLVTANTRMGRIEVKKELGGGLPRILGNPNQIQQVIINLANNALDAMPEGGTLTVRTELLQDGPRSWIGLKVADTGIGIPKELLPRIFESFFTTKPVGQGTGLGLSLAYEIVQKHSGLIEVQSRPGCTEFCVKFPVSQLNGDR